ncbi:MAG: FG-GAP repeat domain-containing protein [Geminicoccaceae bacterium]
MNISAFAIRMAPSFLFAFCLLPLAAHAVSVVDLGTAAGLPAGKPSNGASAVLDYDADGQPDIVLSAHGQEWPLLRQEPVGRFTAVLPGTFAARQDRHGCTSADFNQDGRPDLYCVRGACKGICKKSYANELYLEREDQTFAKIVGAWGADDPHGRGRDTVALDFDRDGDMDLLVANEKSTAFPKVGNHLWRNEGGEFVAVEGTPLAQTMGTFRAAVVPTPSGYPDVVMTTPTKVIYYKNRKGTYRAGRALSGKSSGGMRAWGVAAADLDGDDLTDLVIVREKQLEVRLNDGAFGFGKVSYKLALTQGRDAALCELDGKPGLGIYVVQGARPTHQDIVLLNKGSGRSYRRLKTPRIAKGHGDVATCIPGDFPGYLGEAVLVTNNKWLSGGDRRLGPARLMLVKR